VSACSSVTLFQLLVYIYTSREGSKDGGWRMADAPLYRANTLFLVCRTLFGSYRRIIKYTHMFIVRLNIPLVAFFFSLLYMAIYTNSFALEINV